MVDGVTYSRRTAQGIVHSPQIADVFDGWKGGQERWMFVSPHDDDVVIGAGLTTHIGILEGVEVHAVITTDGRMGYCRLAQRRSIARIRADEAVEGYRALGLVAERLHRLGFPDCNLNPYRGRHFATIGDPTELEGASGLQNAFPYILRQVRPTRVFLPTPTDLHPDHKIVYEEMLISLFHAQGTIWPELGRPIEEVPKVYEYATYCDFSEPPQIRVTGTSDMLERKLEAIRAFASQEQIEALVEVQRNVGPVEYIREVEFNFYSPEKYASLFE
ncbi:MAG: GlcNAc-PI de-N-acetylase [Planctomycetota bacterium]|nr:MAG: GlcNAc-PI de-N-acetylase [Planctomycetota bacterium]